MNTSQPDSQHAAQQQQQQQQQQAPPQQQQQQQFYQQPPPQQFYQQPRPPQQFTPGMMPPPPPPMPQPPPGMQGNFPLPPVSSQGKKQFLIHHSIGSKCRSFTLLACLWEMTQVCPFRHLYRG